MVTFNFKGKEYYMDNKLKLVIDKKVRPAVMKRDEDRVFIVDGAERVGKSVFAMQLAAAIDPDFSLTKVVYFPETFEDAIINAKKGEVILYDEAYDGLGSGGGITKIQKILVSLMMEMGQKNLVVIIVLPTYFLLNKYAAIWRSKGLFHVYKKKGQRGFWVYLNEERKKKLYLLNKKTYSYGHPSVKRSPFKGRFFNQYALDEVEYRAKKNRAFKMRRMMDDKDKKAAVDKVLAQRDACLLLLNKKCDVSQSKISEYLKEYNIDLERQTIGTGIKRFQESLRKRTLKEELLAADESS